MRRQPRPYRRLRLKPKAELAKYLIIPVYLTVDYVFNPVIKHKYPFIDQKEILMSLLNVPFHADQYEFLMDYVEYRLKTYINLLDDDFYFYLEDAIAVHNNEVDYALKLISDCHVKGPLIHHLEFVRWMDSHHALMKVINEEINY